MAVGLVSLLWDLLGGDPMEMRMVDSFGEIDSRLSAINQSMKVVSDIVEENLGIERIWASRREWEDDAIDGLEVWKQRVCQAKTVAVVSNTFYSRWFNDETFIRNFFEGISRGKVARILVYDPESGVLTIRQSDERESKVKEVRESQMKNEIRITLERISEGIERLSEDAKRNLEIRLNNQFYQLAQIIQADDRILVSLYLSGRTGSPSPTLQIKGPSRYYSTYSEQVETLWKHNHELTKGQLKKIYALKKRTPK